MALHVTIIVWSCVMWHMTMTAKWSCHSVDRIMDDEGIPDESSDGNEQQDPGN
jgi:hypothetical protein